jgi:hypothetical protein
LAEVKKSQTFTTATGQQLSVNSTRLEIVVPKGYDVNVFSDVVDYGLQSNKNVIVNFIVK